MSKEFRNSGSYAQPFLDSLDKTSGGHCASTTVQPSGMPSAPDDHVVIVEALVNVPVAATPESQLSVQPSALMSVARQVTELRFVQP